MEIKTETIEEHIVTTVQHNGRLFSEEWKNTAGKYDRADGPALTVDVGGGMFKMTYYRDGKIWRAGNEPAIVTESVDYQMLTRVDDAGRVHGFPASIITNGNTRTVINFEHGEIPNGVVKTTYDILDDDIVMRAQWFAGREDRVVFEEYFDVSVNVYLRNVPAVIDAIARYPFNAPERRLTYRTYGVIILMGGADVHHIADVEALDEGIFDGVIYSKTIRNGVQRYTLPDRTIEIYPARENGPVYVVAAGSRRMEVWSDYMIRGDYIPQMFRHEGINQYVLAWGALKSDQAHTEDRCRGMQYEIDRLNALVKILNAEVLHHNAAVGGKIYIAAMESFMDSAAKQAIKNKRFE